MRRDWQCCNTKPKEADTDTLNDATHCEKAGNPFIVHIPQGSASKCDAFKFIFSCDQAALWMVQSVRLSVRLSVCPSVRLSVCHTFLTMFPSSYHHEIFRSYYQWQKWRPCKKSRSEVKGQGHRGHNPTWPFPDCNSSLNSHMMMKWCI